MLKGEAKKEYQREYMREYQRLKRGSKQGLNIGSKQPNVKPNLMEVLKPPIPYELRVQMYRRGIQYKAGDRLMFPDGRIREVPEMDADGNPIPG